MGSMMHQPTIVTGFHMEYRLYPSIRFSFMMKRIYFSANDKENKPKGFKVAKEDQRSIGLMVEGLDGQ